MKLTIERDIKNDLVQAQEARAMHPPVMESIQATGKAGRDAQLAVTITGVMIKISYGKVDSVRLLFIPAIGGNC